MNANDKRNAAAKRAALEMLQAFGDSHRVAAECLANRDAAPTREERMYWDAAGFYAYVDFARVYTRVY